jgi:glycosyltransferase involved in cell wall biosynthesis
MQINQETLVLGNFGYKTGQLDGQTVKTRNVFSLFNKKFPGQINFFDTDSLKHHKSNIFNMLWMVIHHNRIIYMPAHSNLNYFFPLLFILSKVFKFKIFYFVIGGWLPEYIRNKKIHIKFLKRLTAIFCETNNMLTKLVTLYGFTNVILIPNFRLSCFKPEIKLNSDTLKLVFMSRIMLQKGVDLILRFAEYLNRIEYKNKIIIDFYGPTNEYERENFENDISGYSFMAYRGIIQPEDISSKLSCYDCMLFPTLFTGEGFPGAIIDAYISGIPVIASRISHNHEFIEHGQTGFLFDLSNELDFFDYILKIEQDRTLLTCLKQNAAIKSEEYSAESAWNTIEKSLNENSK